MKYFKTIDYVPLKSEVEAQREQENENIKALVFCLSLFVIAVLVEWSYQVVMSM